MKGFGRGGNQAMQFQYQGFQHQQDSADEDEIADYGIEQYYDEEEDDDDMGVSPGMIFQGGPQGQAMYTGGPPGYGGGISAASGVPFYGQQNRMASSSGFGIGSPGVGVAQSSLGSGGGFTYGMASKGGNLFGPSTTSNPLQAQTAFGVNSSTPSTGLFQFGSVSQFGGFGAGGGQLFGAPATAVDDPYANIAIDLTKVKKSAPPAKPYEQKTEEEKKKEAQEKKSAGAKSNLKKDEKDDDKGKKKGVTFGKSTTYEVTGEDSESGEFNKQDLGGGKGSPRPDKKVISETDLSDGRNEKEKIKEMLEKQEREQLEEIKKMQEWKSQQEEKKKLEGKIGKDMKKQQNDKAEDSIEDSSQLSYQKNKQANEKESSYESDNFEDPSISGSGSKGKINYWPGKDTYLAKKSEESVSKEDDGIYDASMMDAYLKKQQQQKPIQSLQKVIQATSESSDKYDDDEFESASKSQLGQSQIQSPHIPQQQKDNKKPFEYQTAQFKSVLETYTKKENKFIQTDATKYEFMEAGDLNNGTFKEWTLQQNLKDAENLIQDLKSNEALQKQKIFDLEQSMKKRDVEFQTTKRECLNANETSKRLQEQLKDALHKNNLYKIETEELIKQIDLADAKTREKEDDLKLLNAEYERKLKLQEERILFRRSKQEERETYEVKRQCMIEKEEMSRKLDEKQEELDYYQQKVNKLEADNKSLRVGKDSTKRIKELEDEIVILKSQLSTNYQAQQENINLKNIQKDLSKEDQIKLQRELQQLELIVKGYQEENEKSVTKQKQLEKELKLVNERLFNECKKVKDLQQKALLDRDKVYVEQTKEELDIDTVNNMGIQNAISSKELQELHNQVKKLQLEKSDLERDLTLKEGQLKCQINKLRDDKAHIETKLLETEFLVGEKSREIIKLKEEIIKEKQELNARIQELEDKVDWFRSNQKLISEEDQEKQSVFKEIVALREKTKKLEEENKKAKDLEKKCKLLEETIKSKNPNNIPLLIQAAKEKSESSTEQSKLQEKVKKLECELEEKDKDFEKRVRTLRQEQERMRQMYEKRQGQTPEAKRIKEVEDELQKTKDYYNKRIREIEDKYKFKLPTKEKQVTQNDQDKKYKEQIEQITKERNLLAQKVVNLQTTTNKLKDSQNVKTQEDSQRNQLLITIQSLVNLMKTSTDQDKTYSLIQSCVSCVEQLKSMDPTKNNILAQYFKNLTLDLQNQGNLNQKIIQDILDQCKLVDKQPPLKTQNSTTSLNKDLSFIMMDDEQSPNTNKAKPPKQLNPFSIQGEQPKSIKNILKLIINSGIDIEKDLEEKGIKSKRISISQLYQILKEENILKSISVDDVKTLQKYVSEKSGNVTEEIGKYKNDEIDIQDLVNVIMDVSLEVLNKNEVGKDSFLQDRYSQDRLAPSQKSVQDNNNIKVKELQEELKKLKEEKEQQFYDNQSKVQRLTNTINQLTQQKDILEDRLEKLEASKNRIENIMKKNFGLKNTLRKTTGGSTGDSEDILDEVGLIMKRLEYLEQQSEDREKTANQEHIPCKREIQRLQTLLEEERCEKARMLAKKNSEVAYFKSELDTLLSEMKSSFVNKKRANN